MKIRKAAKRDFLHYLLLKREEEQYFTKLLNKKFSISDKEYKKEFLDVLKSKKSLLLVAELNGKLIGFIYGTFFKNIHDSGGFIEVIYVAKDHRRSGVASVLMHEFTKEVKKKKLKKIQLSVNVKNTSAFNFYKKIGYKLHHYDLKKEMK